jgi:hypothetical protein
MNTDLYISFMHNYLSSVTYKYDNLNFVRMLKIIYMIIENNKEEYCNITIS